MPPTHSLAEIHFRTKAVATVARLPLRAGLWTGAIGGMLGHGTGNSTDFQDQRQYVPGDDPRHINWQAYARSGQYTMKLYRPEVTPRVDLIFDASQSMFLDDAKSARTWELIYFCLESALRLGASVKLHALRLDAQEILLERALAYEWSFDGAGTQSTGAAADSISALAAPITGNSGEPVSPAPLRLDVLLRRVPLRAGSLRVLVSDLLGESPPELAASMLSSGRARAVVFAPFSRGESRPEWDGNMELEDVETRTRERRRVEGDVLARYLRAYENHFAMWREQCARRGIVWARIPSEGDFVAALRSEAMATGAIEM